jgi:hypothetical protein
MSAALTYEPNDVRNVRPSFIASEEAALLASARAGDSAAFESLVMPQWGWTGAEEHSNGKGLYDHTVRMFTKSIVRRAILARSSS